MVKSGILRGITEGRLPPKQEIDFHIPFNLMKSETLVWVMRDVDYQETVTRRERQGTSDGMSFRVARGVYYRTGTTAAGGLFMGALAIIDLAKGRERNMG